MSLDIRSMLAIPGLAAAGLLSLIASVILTKPNTTYQSGILWWIAFVLASALVIEISVKDSSLRRLFAICLIPAAALFAGLVFRLGLQVLLFSANAAPLVILGSGITTSANLQAQLQDVRADAGSVDWAAQKLREDQPDAFSVALQALTPSVRQNWTTFTQGNAQRENASELGLYLSNIAVPELRQHKQDLEAQIAATPPGSIPAGQVATLVFGLLFYALIAAVTPIALVLALFAKPQLQSGISFLFKTPTARLNRLRKNLDALLKILLVAGAIVAVFL